MKGEGPNWLELPRDIIASIFQRLDAVEVVMSASHVCSLWRNICKDPLMWRTIDMTNLCTRNIRRYDLEKVCRCVVQRSSGHLEDIRIECFATDNLLKYIGER